MVDQDDGEAPVIRSPRRYQVKLPFAESSLAEMQKWLEIDGTAMA